VAFLCVYLDDPLAAWRYRRLLKPFWLAYRLWLRNDCIDLSAAFAYHTLQSFLPALLIAMALVSRFLGKDQELLSRLVELVGQVLPEAMLPVFATTLDRFSRQGLGAGALGVLLLALNASNIYLTLQRGADRLWWNRPFGFDYLKPGQLVRRFLLLRLKAIALILLIGPLLIMDQFISSVRFFGSVWLRDFIFESLPTQWTWFASVSYGVDLLLSLVVNFLASLLFLWLLPSRRVALRSLLPGSILVSVSVTLLNLMLGRILLTLGLRFQAYGLVGGVLVLTLWMWLMGVILYYGQCLSVILASRLHGGRSALSDV
jgi:membrane protein